MKHRASVLSWVLMALLFAACNREPEHISNAYFKEFLVVYPGLTFDTAMGGNTSSDIGGPVISTGMSWFYKTDRPADDIVKWYSERWPSATRKAESGETTLKLVPPNAEVIDGDDKEEVYMVVRKSGEKTEVQLGESIKPNKHKY